jgi:hypothetical protein
MSDILVTHKRLVAAGLSEAQAKAFLRLVAEAESGRFNQQDAHDRLLGAHYTTGQSALLIGEALNRLARRVSGSS